MRNSIFAIALLMLLGVAVAKGSGRILPGSGEPKEKTCRVVIDSIECRSDLSRVYCRLQGRPNTSFRIDSISLNGSIKATDIDPIYFERGFQFEEEGEQPVEIDFPALNKKPGRFYLLLSTPYGPVKATFNGGK